MMKDPAKKKLFHLIALVFSFCAFSLSNGTATAGSEYRCSNHSHHDLVFHPDQHGNIIYQFTGDLTCWHHQDASTADSIFTFGVIHDTDKEQRAGHYRVTVQVNGKSVQEKISYRMAGWPEASINTKYTCAHDPFTTKNPACVLRTQSNEPFPTTYGTAIAKAAYNSVPLSIGLYNGDLPANLNKAATPPAQQDHSPPKQEDLAGPSAKSLVTDITYTKHSFSNDRRKYFFNFTTQQGCYQVGADTAANDHNPCSRTEKLDAMATKYINGQNVDISIRGSGHHIDLSYRCDNINDPFLDPTNRCHLVHSPSSFTDSLAKGLVQQKYPLVGLFAKTIANAKRQQLIWKALADSMKPKIFAAGKAAPPEGSKLVFGTDNELILDVDSSRDIKRDGDWPVTFFVKGQNGHVRDVHGKTIDFPITSKYTGNSYNSTVWSIGPLEPGEYKFFATIPISLTQEKQSKTIHFQVRSHLTPKEAPVITSPQENQKLPAGKAVLMKVLVAPTWFGTDFDAKVEIEHSRLAKQEPYKSYSTVILDNHDGSGSVGGQHHFNDVTGDFRMRARMLNNGKPSGPWSEWHHFHIGGKAIPLMHRGLAIVSPKEGESYTGTIPVKISLPETMKKEGKLTLIWAQSGNGAARMLKQKSVTIKPNIFFATTQDVGELVNKAGGEVGEIQLSISLEGSDKHDAARFHVGVLGTPVQNPGQKMSGHLSLAHKGLHGDLTTKMQMDKKQALETGIRSINPQPEPPGKTARTMRMPLQVVPIGKKFQLSAAIPFQIRNTPFSRLPFEVRYRSGSTGPYKAASRIRHEFARKNGQTMLTLHPDKPGQYQVRFRANHKSAWTPWQSFQVTGPNRAAHLARNIKLHPASTRAINPQPEPSGKNARMLHTTIQRPKRLVGNISTTNTLTAKPISLVAPTITTPKNGQKFMLTGKSTHIKAKISHASGQQVRVQVEQKKKGHFVPIKKGITIHSGKSTTSVDIVARGTGQYRLRAKNSSGKASWSGWTKFTVDHLMKKKLHFDNQKSGKNIFKPKNGISTGLR